MLLWEQLVILESNKYITRIIVENLNGNCICHVNIVLLGIC